MEAITVPTRSRTDLLRHPESALMLAIVVIAYANAMARLFFG